MPTMGFPTVHIASFPHHKNTYSSGEGVWLVSSLIEQAKDLPVVDLPLCAIFSGQQIWNPITSPYQLARHMKRVQDASLDYPIILDEEGFIMDGWHRVAKALLEGRETIKAVRFEKTPNPDFTKESE